MTTIEQSIFINATPEAVTAVSQDITRLPEWFSGIEKAEPDGKWPATGGTAHVTFKSAGITYKLFFTSSEFTSGKSMTIGITGTSTGTNQWGYTPENGGTMVSYKMEYDLAGGLVGQAIDKIVVARANEKAVAQSLENLKVIVEG